MTDPFTADDAFEEFEEWYEKCLDSGLEPEAIVNQMGIKLIVNQEQIVLYEKFVEWDAEVAED